ncbi:MAG TPA: BamA/TamA family outer membrane protein [Anaeromyxobacteraceae bacterium]|nr:BamA/TamA family outer membrane protein [Anaeromyxobacteraceae bacterium]
MSARRPGHPAPSAALLLAALALAASGCFAFPFRASDDPQRPTVTDFEIRGTNAIDAGELKSHLATQASSRRYVVFREEQYLDPDAFANDKQRIVRYYQAHGYYAARVVSSELVPDGEGRVKVRVGVEEGPPTRVSLVDVTGLEGAPEAAQRLGQLPIKVGDVFTDAAYDQGRADLLAALGATGYAKAEVTQRAEVDPSRSEARVHYAVTPGPRYRFGSIFVAGAAAIPRSRIREEAERVITPGTFYDATELPKAQAGIVDLGVFGGVRVTPSIDEAKQTVTPVVQVREAPFRTIRAGPSLDLTLTRIDAAMVAGWQHRNWLGGLRRLSLDARAGWAFLPAESKNGFAGLFSADLLQPSVIRKLLDFNIHGELQWGLEPLYNYRAERLRIGFPLRVGRIFTFIPSVNWEIYHLSGTPSLAPPGSNSQVLLFQTCPSRDPNLCVLSYFEQRFAFDLRDDPINTTTGVYLTLALQEGVSVRGNGSAYVRYLPEARAFASLPGSVVAAARARVGVVNPLSAPIVPVVATFTSGGPNMRGYYTQRLSPMLQDTPGHFIPVGGYGLLDGSFELRFPIYGAIGGAAFMDFGNVQAVASDALKIQNLQWAAGVGLRYKTPFGPIRVDVARRLGNGTVQVVDRSNGVIGATTEPRFAFGFSIGEF